MIRLQITFTTDEVGGLFKMSESNLRSPRDQVRFLIQKDLILTKLLREENISSSNCKYQTNNVDEP
jgi:hypothetical protein